MKRYGIVNFDKGGKTSAALQSYLITEMNNCGIIHVDEADIRRMYAEDCTKRIGCTCNFVLHNAIETEKFRDIMRRQVFRKDWVRWRTTGRLGKDNEFRLWLESRGEY